MRINVRPDVVGSTMSDDLVKRLQAELAAARAALKKYGQHRRTCRLLQEWPAGMEPQLSRCSCGLRQALAAAQEHETEEQSDD